MTSDITFSQSSPSLWNDVRVVAKVVWVCHSKCEWYHCLTSLHGKMINHRISYYFTYQTSTFTASWSKEIASVETVKVCFLTTLNLTLDLNPSQATNWLYCNADPNDIRGYNVYWSVLVKRYLLQLQEEDRDRKKTTRWGLLPSDPQNTVGRHIVLHTKRLI